jgi:hypothetical protein
MEMTKKHRCDDANWGKPKVPVPAQLYSPQISHGLTWHRNRASAVRGQQLTASAMERPLKSE